MTKGNFHAIFDPQVYNEFANNVGKGNIAKNIEDFMRSFNARDKGDVKSINIEILNLEIATLQKQKIKVDSELNSKLTQRERLMAGREKEEKDRLKSEKDKLENAKRCVKCDRIIEEDKKIYNLGNGKVACRACFMTGRVKIEDISPIKNVK